MNTNLIKVNTERLFHSLFEDKFIFDSTIGSSDDKILINEKSFDKVENIQMDFVEGSHNPTILCIFIQNIDSLHQTLDSNILEKMNIPVVFILERQDPEMIKVLYKYHYINICFSSQPNTLLKEHILYMFKNFSFFTGLKSKNVLNKINTKSFTKKEVEIIRLLAESPLKKLCRQKLYTKVWGEKEINANTLDVHICNIRRKLKETSINISTLEEGRVSLNII